MHNAPDNEAVARMPLFVSLSDVTSRLLMEGGDDRIRPSGAVPAGAIWDAKNHYFCSPCPPPREAIVRSYSTCTPPSEDGYLDACQTVHRVATKAYSWRQCGEDVRARIRHLLSLPQFCEVVLTTSGTDAEYVPLLVATNYCRALGGDGCVTNVILSPDEVGSGTLHAASGCHFTASTPLSGKKVQVGQKIAGWAVPIQTAVVPIRNPSDGALLPSSQLAHTLRVTISAALQPPGSNVVILHVVDTKLGAIVPSRDVVAALLQDFPTNLVVVLDACQLRLTANVLQWYLTECEFGMVALTGSKFGGGPAFCGAVACSPRVAALLQSSASLAVPPELACYLTPSDVPVCMARLRRALAVQGSSRRHNAGLLLRWVCALQELEPCRGLFVPPPSQPSREDLGPFVRAWVGMVQRLVRDGFSPTLSCYDSSTGGGVRDHVAGCNTMVLIRCKGTTHPAELTMDQLRRVCQLLTLDLSQGVPRQQHPMTLPVDVDDTSLASVLRRPCHLGQPVWLGSFGVVRSSLGAPVVRRLACSSFLAVLKEDQAILQKLWVVVENFEYFAAAFS